ncbi:helix-turn-helix domain-containing protein [Actinomadura sp. HBU206391]|uniref:helix-turn-helix domain-containing protein n=1 Tax=Actinomadura sp. HBU206391 TaxID=2731692 RepID=UPI00164F7646|nr:helix-turn-helix transcriptional regulator [Actinomadura sp. HBU206391]MBC6459636.1 helix-turn-helix domain-containing protein [Actinomadura sp. HBU206391]
MKADTPSLRQRWLGAKLADLRQQAGFTLLSDAAAKVGRSTASLSRIENGVVSIPPRDVPPILDAYGVRDPRLRERLMIVAAEIQQERRGWWVEHGDVLSPSYIDLIRLEASAREIWTYEVQIVPGLLQTDAYARAAALASWEPSADELDEFVGVRMSRKAVLTRDEPATLRVVLGEAALRNRLGGRDAFRAQLAHLRECAGRPNISLQILPFTDQPHPGISGAFTVLRLPSLDVAHVELMSSDAYIEDQDGVQQHVEAFKRLADLALSPAASERLISETIDKL